MRASVLALAAVLLALPAPLSAQSGGLTRAQVRELQAALAREGCEPGTIDGRMGPRTRRAIACARKAKGVDGNNANELFRALDLEFTVADSMGMGGIMRSGASSRARAARRDRAHDKFIGRDSAVIYDSSTHKSRGKAMKERSRGRDTLPPGRTPR